MNKKYSLIEETNKVKPILKWAGGKSSTLSQLLPFFPKSFNKYFEPFLGGGAVFFSLDSLKDSYLNDSNKEIITLYEVVRDDVSSLIKSLDILSLKYSEKFYYELRSEIPSIKLDRAARTLFLNKTGFNGLYRQNSKGIFNVPYGKRAKCPALYDKDNILSVSERLKNASLFSLDFEKIIDKSNVGDFVYCDPPYEPLSSTSSFNAYQKGGFSQDEQKRLKETCLKASKRGATVLISNSSADFIKSLYSDCEVHIISARRSINSNGNSRGNVDEVLVVLNSANIKYNS